MRKRSLTPYLLFAGAIALVCIGVIILGNIALGLPEYVENTFGLPSSELGPIDRYWLSAQLYWGVNELIQPADLNADLIEFSIELGEPTEGVIERLWEAELINDQGAFRAYLQYAGFDTRIQTGTFLLSARMMPIQIAQELLDGRSSEVDFQILAGWRLEEIAGSLTTSGLDITPGAFLSSARSNAQDFVNSAWAPPGGSLEGFMFPDSYVIRRDVSVDEMMATFVLNFHEHMTDGITTGIIDQGLAPYEGLILASIIEREAVLVEEMALIASVFLNRLAIDMNLETDPTVQYALGWQPGQDTWWKNPLSLTDLQVDSIFNTYLYPGLPPTPIANPGMDAIQAVAFPQESTFYYFRAACDGSGGHNFALTFEEHQANACP